MIDGYPLQNPRAAWRVYAGQAVIVSTDDSSLHMLNHVGTAIWTAADGGTDVDAIAERVCAAFEVDRAQARSDVVRFIESLVERGLLEVLDEPCPLDDRVRKPAAVEASSSRPPYEPPTVRSEAVFETTALGCMKTSLTGCAAAQQKVS